MSGVRLLLGGAFAVLLALAVSPGCGGRAGSCAGFDSCQDAKPCPRVRCICDDGERIAPATCRADGTCTTASDCASVCTAQKSKCAHPPATCESYLATECECAANAPAKTRFAEAWDCTRAAAPTIIAKDCDEACSNPIGQGGGGGFPTLTTSSDGSGGGSVGGSGSSTSSGFF